MSSLRTATRSVLISKGRQVSRSRPTGPQCACARTAGRGARMLRRQCTVAIGTKVPLVAFVRRPWPMRTAKNPARIRAFWPRAWMALGWPRPHHARSGRSGHILYSARPATSTTILPQQSGITADGNNGQSARLHALPRARLPFLGAALAACLRTGAARLERHSHRRCTLESVVPHAPTVALASARWRLRSLRSPPARALQPDLAAPAGQSR